MKVLDPIIELKQTKLWKYLKRIDEDYANNAVLFVKSIVPILNSIKEFFPYYTRHDAHHGFQVCNGIADILLKECFNKKNAIHLSPSETFLLICSAYAHDLGMAVFPNEEDVLLHDLDVEKNEGWKTNKNLQNYLRDNHSNRGGKY